MKNALKMDVFQGAFERGSNSGIGIWLFLGLLGVMALTIHLGCDDLATKTLVWGVAILLAGIAFAYYGDGCFDMFSPKFYVGLTFAIFYGVGAMYPYFHERGGYYSEDIDRVLSYYPQASLVSFSCLIGFMFGYRNKWAIQKGMKSTLLCWRYPKRSIALLWILLATTGSISIVMLIANNAFFQTSTELQSPLFVGAAGFFASGVNVAIAISTAMAIRQRTKPWIITSALTIVLRILLGISSGSKTQVFVGLMFAALSWNYAVKAFTRKQTALLLLVTSAVLLVLMPFSVIYRGALAESASENQSLSLALSQMKITADTLSGMDDRSLLDLTTEYAGARLSNTAIVANILRYQHEGGELHYGSSYARMLLMFIPRFIWPDKPPVTISGAFNVEVFGTTPDNTVLGVETSNTAVGVTMVGEQLYNFPALLAPFGMVLIGMFFRWLYEVFRSGLPRSPVIAIGVYAAWWYIMIFSTNESNWASSFNGAATYTIFMFLLFWVLKMRRMRHELAPVKRWD